jgi:hypothetical protein
MLCWFAPGNGRWLDCLWLLIPPQGTACAGLILQARSRPEGGLAPRATSPELEHDGCEIGLAG